MANRLARESSPCLQQHADNPVDWYAWNDYTLRLARELDKPILLSIGYSACQCSGDPLFARIAEQTAAWVMREMQSSEGGYYLSLDELRIALQA